MRGVGPEGPMVRGGVPLTKAISGGKLCSFLGTSCPGLKEPEVPMLEVPEQGAGVLLSNTGF